VLQFKRLFSQGFILGSREGILFSRSMQKLRFCYAFSDFSSGRWQNPGKSRVKPGKNQLFLSLFIAFTSSAHLSNISLVRIGKPLGVLKISRPHFRSYFRRVFRDNPISFSISFHLTAIFSFISFCHFGFPLLQFCAFF